MKEKLILICEDCLSRNYSIFKNKNLASKRLIIKKFCSQCNKHKIHKESK